MEPTRQGDEAANQVTAPRGLGETVGEADKIA
jgi:hypothetical protein